MKKGNYKSSPVKMIDRNGNEKWFESLTAAGKYAGANSWTMSIKMQVFGYFEDKAGNKYYRLDEMKSKNIYESSSPKIVKEQPKGKIKKSTNNIPVYVDGIYYENCTKAAIAIGANKNSIANYLKWGINSIKGHKIEPVTKDNTPKEVFEKKKEEPKQKSEPISILVSIDNPAIKAINDRIIKILSDANVLEEIQELSEAIKKLSK